MVASAFGRLSRREQRLVATFVALLTAGFVYAGIIEPIFAGRARMEQKIETLAGDIEAMIKKGKGKMTPFEGKLSAEEIKAVAAYVKGGLK